MWINLWIVWMKHMFVGLAQTYKVYIIVICAYKKNRPVRRLFNVRSRKKSPGFGLDDSGST